MVRPLLAQLMENHLKEKENDDQNVTYFKRTIIHEIKEKFKLGWTETSSVSVKQIASFLDPRYKDLEFEPIGAREKIRTVVKDLLERFRTQNNNLEQEPPVQRSDLEFLYGNIITDSNDRSIQFQNYIAEPQLRFDLNAFEWWKFRENKYPALAELAKQHLAIPATSVSSERCFSTAGNIVTSKRTCLLTKNVNMLIFLYQNQELLH
ncbi:zinc finger BED domain-containing protein 1-like [Myzus persicae]|uniref:zinc finger BED domain-containing protein 1-like n=1 Tax=Myzus persicae TaxID=13164 RepID=UPI000B9375E9|nr:zinc finger BED domain-containing protein 1-like [Myzus persicae]